MTGPTGAPRLLLGVARLAVLGILVLLAAACGVQLQEQAEPLPGGLLPTETTTPTPTRTAMETMIFFVAGRELEGVPEPVSELSAEGIMEALATGPPVEREAELRSLLLDPLTGERLLVVASTQPSGEVVVRRSEGYTKLPATDQILLTGQVVHSMAEIGLVRVVMIDPAGATVPVTLPDGRVQEGAVTAEEFAPLLVS